MNNDFLLFAFNIHVRCSFPVLKCDRAPVGMIENVERYFRLCGSNCIAQCIIYAPYGDLMLARCSRCAMQGIECFLDISRGMQSTVRYHVQLFRHDKVRHFNSNSCTAAKPTYLFLEFIF